MKWLLAAALAAFFVYLVYDTFIGRHIRPIGARGRLCDYTASGSVYEDIPSALARGVRLLEVHLYSDERDQPVVATKPQQNGYDFATDNISFEQVCVDLVNDAFPSKDPFVLSIVPHTSKSVTLNKAAEHLQLLHRHLIAARDIQQVPLDKIANKLVIVSGGVSGTDLEPLVNLSWDSHGVRRLTVHQGLHSRDPTELRRFNKDFITIVAPEPELKHSAVDSDALAATGAQWILVASGPPGFVKKSS